jgi:glycosyltransferase involved in cell wall biosynthesis
LLRKKVENYIEILASILADIIVTEALLPHFETRPRGLFPYKLHPGLRYINLNRFKLLKTIDQRENVIGFIGRLEEDKGVIDFIKISQLISLKTRKHGLNARFYIVGSGRLDKVVKSITARMSDKGIDIKFYGFIENDLLPTILNETKILILPYKSPAEGIPTVVLEAFACGVPVIAYDTGLIKSVVINGLTGFVVPLNNYRAIVNLVVQLLSHQELLMNISRIQRKFAEEFLSYEKALERYEVLFTRLWR